MFVNIFSFCSHQMNVEQNVVTMTIAQLLCLSLITLNLYFIYFFSIYISLNIYLCIARINTIL